MQAELRQWCCQQLDLEDGQLVDCQTVAGDASFRRYYRLQLEDGRTLVVMDAPPEKENSAPFVDIARRLRAAGLHAPEIMACDLGLGYLLLEDFGDRLYKEVLENSTMDTVLPGIFGVLEGMARRVDSRGLPAYSRELLLTELSLFPDWYLARHQGQQFSDEEQVVWQGLCQRLLDSAQSQPQVFVHRDFHSCNLMLLKNGDTGIIDFQDAVCGPLTYDLISILLDRYISWPREQLEHWFEQFRQLVAADVDAVDWRQWCDWMGLQRNIKIVGIFARLAYRDGKHSYIDLIPRFAAYVRDTLALYPELSAAHALMESRL